MAVRRFYDSYEFSRRGLTVVASIPSTWTRFRLDFSPVTIEIARLGTDRATDRSSTNSAFAAPSTGGAWRRTSNEPPRVPATPDLPERGMTRTSMRTPFDLGLIMQARHSACPPRMTKNHEGTRSASYPSRRHKRD